MDVLTKGAEKVYEERNESEMCVIISGDVVAHARGQQRPKHVWKREQQQSATAESVNGPDGGPSEQKINKPETERSYQSFPFGRSPLLEDG